MCIDIVYFNPDGDGVTALYIDGKLHSYGDYYHDKIDDWILGFLYGLNFANVQFTKTEHQIRHGKIMKNVVEYGNSPPELLENVK